ncbi:MAG: efflux RND transporter periplasmic adaptor subunit [Granulosicoccus sp.]
MLSERQFRRYSKNSAGIPPVSQPQISRARSLRTFLINLVLAFALLMAGVWIIKQRASAETSPGVREPLAVKTLKVEHVSSYPVEVSYAGRVEAPQSTALAFEQSGTIRQMIVDEGALVEAGERLAVLDDRSLQALLGQRQAAGKQLASAVERAELDLLRAESLDNRGFAAEQALDNARLNLAQANASMEQNNAALIEVAVAIDKTEITAPFAGVISGRTVDKGAVVSVGAPVLTIHDNSAFNIRVGLPAERLEDLDKSENYQVRAGGQLMTARFIGVAPDLALGTQTVSARFRALPASDTLVFGQTAELVLKRQVDQSGFWVPVSALSEGDRSLWSLFVLDDAELEDSVYRVSRQHVELSHTDGVRAFVLSSSNDSPTIVVDGVHKIAAGQIVRVVQ